MICHATIIPQEESPAPDTIEDCCPERPRSTSQEVPPKEGIGSQLRRVRSRLGLTLREVEERSLVLGQQWGNTAYGISASWLDRVERENRALSATKLIVIAYIYNLTSDQMLSLCPGATEGSAELELVSSLNATSFPRDRLLEPRASLWLPDKLVTDPPPEHTTLLPSDQGVLRTQYRRGIVGRRDRTMEPMVLPGSIVLIDTQKRAIAHRKDWVNEYDRPIYFLFTRTGYVCGFCELDRKSEWLQLVPHMLSFQTKEDRRWRYRKEVEVVGTVAAMFTRRFA